jgi:hypothetical protein
MLPLPRVGGALSGALQGSIAATGAGVNVSDRKEPAPLAVQARGAGVAGAAGATG